MSSFISGNSLLRFSFFITVMLCLSCSTAKKKEKVLTVYAAASVSKVMHEIATDFKKSTGITLRMNFASSGTLARQLEGGAECDYFVSASREWMSYADSLNLIDKQSIHALVNNRIVAVVPVSNTDLVIRPGEIARFPSLFQGRLSIGDPNYVPVGKYAQQIIEKYNWKSALNGKYLPAKDARDALFMVEMGEAEMGLVYYSDAFQSKKVRIVYTFPAQACDIIRYYGAAGKNKKKALTTFISYLQSEKAHQIWMDNGFNHR